MAAAALANLAFTPTTCRSSSASPRGQGPFIQEKHLRALPQPLLSKGRFVLARDHGLLWLLDTPLQQDYRITPRASPGATRTAGKPAQPSAGAEQNRLFLAVLQGDSSGLQRISNWP
jgi:hypothetical protein